MSTVRKMSTSRSRTMSRSRSRSRSRTRSRRKVRFEIKYELVDRKQQDVHLFWKWSIVFLTFITVPLTVTSVLSFKSLRGTYDNRCFTKATLGFNASGQVDEMETEWGNTDLCDYMVRSPMLITIFAMFWLEMFYIYGRGGYTLNEELHIADQHWTMVMPASVCFGIVALYKIGHVATLHKYLRSFCGQLKVLLRENRNKECGYLVGFYSITPEESLFPIHLNYNLLYHSSLWTMITCILATIIMVFRVYRAADFEIVPVKSPSSRRRQISQRPTRVSIMNTSSENMIFIDRNFVSSRSVHFKSHSI